MVFKIIFSSALFGMLCLQILLSNHSNNLLVIKDGNIKELRITAIDIFAACDNEENIFSLTISDPFYTSIETILTELLSMYPSAVVRSSFSSFLVPP